MTCLLDVGLLPCSHNDGLVPPGLNAFDMQLPPLGRIPRQLGVTLDLDGEVAEILRPLSVYKIRGRLECFGAGQEAGAEILVVACLRFALVTTASYPATRWKEIQEGELGRPYRAERRP